MNKTKTILITAFVAVAAGLGLTTTTLINQPVKQGTAVQSAQTQNDNLISFTAEANKSVLDQLKTKANVEVKDSAYGPFVDSVNGKVGGTDNKYWAYYVDGQMAQVGAAEYITKGGEKIEWKFE